MMHGLLTEIRKLADESPACKYERPTKGFAGACFYTKGVCTNGSEGCIIGQALAKLGHIEKLVEFDECGGKNAEAAIHALGLTISETDVQWCSRVQRAQDGGRCWGYAVGYAEGYNDAMRLRDNG